MQILLCSLCARKISAWIYKENDFVVVGIVRILTGSWTCFWNVMKQLNKILHVASCCEQLFSSFFLARKLLAWDFFFSFCVWSRMHRETHFDFIAIHKLTVYKNACFLAHLLTQLFFFYLLFLRIFALRFHFYGSNTVKVSSLLLTTLNGLISTINFVLCTHTYCTFDVCYQTESLKLNDLTWLAHFFRIASWRRLCCYLLYPGSGEYLPKILCKKYLCVGKKGCQPRYLPCIEWINGCAHRPSDKSFQWFQDRQGSIWWL